MQVKEVYLQGRNMPKEMKKKRHYMCSLCGKVWENDEVEKGKNKTLRLEGYRDSHPYSDRKKECPICHGALYIHQGLQGQYSKKDMKMFLRKLFEWEKTPVPWYK